MVGEVPRESWNICNSKIGYIIYCHRKPFTLLTESRGYENLGLLKHFSQMRGSVNFCS